MPISFDVLHNGGLRVVPGVPWNPIRSIDGRLNGTPLSSYRTKKTAAMAHLRML